MISWIVTIVLLSLIVGALVVAEIRDDRAWARYNRQRDEHIKKIFLTPPK